MRQSLESCNFGFSKALYYLSSEQQRRWSDCANARLICTFIVRIWHKQIFSWRDSLSYNIVGNVLRFPNIYWMSLSYLFSSGSKNQRERWCLSWQMVLKQFKGWNIDQSAVSVPRHSQGQRLTGFPTRNIAVVLMKYSWRAHKSESSEYLL